MPIHHFTVPAHDPARVASALAEVPGACVLPHPAGKLGGSDMRPEYEAFFQKLEGAA